MSITSRPLKFLAPAFVALALPSVALAWGDTYRGPSTGMTGPHVTAYGGSNYCPAGLQPVVLNGVICCGRPNTNMSYQQLMAHPMPRKARRAHRHRHTHTYSHTHGHGHHHHSH